MLVSAIILAVLLVACSEAPPELPFCRQSVKESTPIASPAGCIIIQERYLLVVKHRLSGKYDIPAGQGLTNETAACTAHRETFEETGLNVEVTALISQSATGLQFFSCQKHQGFNAPNSAPPVPFWSSHEISHVEWIDPYSITSKDWRFADQLVEVRAAFTQAAKKD